MRYLSVCSGIEAASVAWRDLGWSPVGFSEIEVFPSAVLQHYHPTVKNFGDMTQFEDWDLDGFDLLVGGTPCQSFSVSGLRGGLDDARGNLALTYCRILERWRPRWLLWENVPGVLTSNNGRDFYCLISAMAELGYGFCYRVLDAKHFGVPQNRRRVFVVGYLGDHRPAAEVLLEPESMRGLYEQVPQVPARRTADASTDETSSRVVHCRKVKDNCFRSDGKSSTIAARDYKSPRDLIIHDGRPRKMTPLEVERFMGFPDNYTKVAYSNYCVDNLPDKSRYKALGNSMAVPVMRWIGERINLVNWSRTF